MGFVLLVVVLCVKGSRDRFLCPSDFLPRNAAIALEQPLQDDSAVRSYSVEDPHALHVHTQTDRHTHAHTHRLFCAEVQICSFTVSRSPFVNWLIFVPHFLLSHFFLLF